MTGKRERYLQRWLGTAASFALFGLVGLVLGVVVFPVLRIMPMAAERRSLRAKAIVTYCFYTFIRLMNRMGVLSYDFAGSERLGRPGQLIIANHPSLIDVVFLIGFVPGAGCVVKSALWRNPFTGGVVTAAGYIPNAPTDVMIERASEALREGAVIMFPEGTRTKPGEPLQLHRGAASVALRAASTLTPVYITVQPTTLTKGTPWYRIPWRRPHFSLTVGSDIELSSYRALTSPPLASRALNDYLFQEFTSRLAQRSTACDDLR